MKTETGLLVERELSIEARPETVWEFLVDPERAIRWMGTAAVLDPRPGGEYSVQVTREYAARGKFLEVDPPRRVVWTWGWEPDGMSPVAPGSTIIEIELEPEGSGTRLRFRHSGLRDTEEAGKHEHGWDHYLGRLVVVAAGGDAGPDPWLDDA